MPSSQRWLEVFLVSDAAAPVWVDVKGASMEPSLVDGDRVLVEPLGAGVEPYRGEVVLARLASSLVIHRVVTVSDGVAVTKGDARVDVDPPVRLDGVLGRVVQVRPSWRGRTRRHLRRARSFAKALGGTR